MRIAMIGQKGLPATYGGIERHVEEIGTRLVNRGHEVVVYCRYDYSPAEKYYEGIRLLRLPSLNTKHLGTATHVAVSTLDSMFRDYDVVHYHALGPSLFAGFPRLRGTSTVVTIHGLDWQRDKWGPGASWVLKRCEFPAVNFPSSTVVVSQTLQRYFREHHRRETVFIPNGTILPDYRPARSLGKFGLEAGKYVLFVGRMVPEKGVHFLTEAFQSIDTDMKLALAGGYAYSPDYQEKIKSYESDRIKLLGYVFGEGLAELWSNAYVVVLPSTLEGLSIALLEALSYGRCALISDIPENLEVAGECAPSFRSRDVDDLRTKLKSLIDDPELVKSYERQARQHVEAHFSWDRVVDDLEALYRRLRGAGDTRG
jgi:glycosyltransferase involved in cell wall biosynthesis